MGEIMLTSTRIGKLSSSFVIADKFLSQIMRLRQLMLMLGMLSFTINVLRVLGCFFGSISVLLSRKS